MKQLLTPIVVVVVVVFIVIIIITIAHVCSTVCFELVLYNYNAILHRYMPGRSICHRCNRAHGHDEQPLMISCR